MRHKLSLLSLSKVLLFLLVVSINLREPYVHSREILYILFVITSFWYGNYKKIFSFLLFLVIWGISLLYNVIKPGSNAMDGNWFESVINAAYLFLLVFSNKKYYHIIIKAFMSSAYIVSIVTISLWLICYCNDSLRLAMSSYFSNLQSQTDLTFIKIDTRLILGNPFFFVWYRTSPIIIPALGYCYISRLQGNFSKINSFSIILFTIALVLSGTRANLLTAILLLFFYVVFALFRRHYYYLAITLLVITISVGISYSVKFLNDKQSISSSIKHLHQESYFKTFQSDYLRTFFFGWGCGSTFYSTAINKQLDITELSHLETIRRYGFISFCLIIFFIWLKPLLKKLSNVQQGYLKYFYVVVVLSYIFVACTNPYLLDSLGFCVLLFFDSFFEYETFNCIGNVQRRKIYSRAA